MNRMNKIVHATQRLREEDIRFNAVSNGKQFIVDPGGLRISFWPTSGLFYTRNRGNPKPTSHLNGVEDLIRYIKGA